MKFISKHLELEALRFTSETSLQEALDFLYDCKNVKILSERAINNKRMISFDIDDYTHIDLEENYVLIKFGHDCYYAMELALFDLLYNQSAGDVKKHKPSTIDTTNIKKLVVYKATNAKEEFEYVERIHQQLIDNDDYINSNIVVSRSAQRKDDTEFTVICAVSEDSKSNPHITI